MHTESLGVTRLAERCVGLAEENKGLRARLADAEERLAYEQRQDAIAIQALRSAEARVAALEEGMRVALGAMQANIAYATRKDEPALARGIDAVRALLSPAPEPEGERR